MEEPEGKVEYLVRILMKDKTDDLFSRIVIFRPSRYGRKR